MYAINMNDGTISVYMSGVTNCCFAQIPDDVAMAVADGKIPWQKVTNAINRKRYMDKDFDWNQLRADEDKLNVRRGEFGFTREADTPAEEVKPRDANLVSLADVMGEGTEPSDMTRAARGRKATAKPKGEAVVPQLKTHDDGAPGVIG